MKIETFRYKNVLSDGTFIDQGGQVEVKGKIVMSQNNGGCDLKNCKCSEGYWLTIIKPKTNEGIIEGLKVLFNDKKEMQKFFNEHELICR